MWNKSYHTPVLFQESIEGLNLDPGGVYVDATFGGGGHSRGILEKLTTGTLIGIDQDSDAKENVRKINEEFPKRSFTFIDSNFRDIGRQLKFHGYPAVDGIIADLGVSSHQFDEPDRGFSTRWDSDLDMRMNQQQDLTASDLLNQLDEMELVHLFSFYGEIKNARTLASRIIQRRSESSIEKSGELKEIAEELAPKGRTMKYLAQVFQALRIEVNDEMGALKEFLNQCEELIKPGGRMVVISYHSLEDRMVKNYMVRGNIEGMEKKDFYGNLLRPFDPINRKVITPTQGEIEKNNRARSARLRIAERRQWR